MTIAIAILFAQSLLGELSQPAGRHAEKVAAPYAQANAEANAAVMAEVALAESQNTPVQTIETPPAPVAEEAAPEPPVAPASAAEETAPEPPVAPASAAEETAPEPPVAPAPVEEAPTPAEPPPPPPIEMPRSVKITSERTDYDRREGVIMFDRNVFVDDAEYKMHSDQLYVFLDGTNELKRIVAIGNVSITNETRVGSCAKAAYTKSVGKVVMYGDSSGARARLADCGKRKSEVEGRKITFWIDSEQVEVEGSTVTLDAGGYGGKDGAKRLLGK